MPEMKQCHTCGEEIQAIAKMCPHCQTWQTKWRFDSGDFKWSIFWSILPIAIFFIVLSYKMGVIGKNNYQDYASSLIITESELHYSTNESDAYISVLGKIKNESDVSWEDFYFEIQFYDDKNNLIDTISKYDRNLIVLPYSEATFRVRGRADKSKEEYISHKIIIKKASDADD